MLQEKIFGRILVIANNLLCTTTQHYTVKSDFQCLVSKIPIDVTWTAI